MTTFDTLISDLTRDIHRAQPKDALQFCANWFQSRLEEQRAQTRDVLSRRAASFSRDLPAEIYADVPLSGTSTTPPRAVSPYSHHAIPPHHSPLRNSVAHSPFG